MSDLLPAAASPIVIDDDATEGTWIDVCAVTAVAADRGVAALIDDEPVAIFRLESTGRGDQWFAIDHVDPVTGAPVMARGLVGSLIVDGVDTPTVASPLYKQRYDLRTGLELGGTSRLRTWPIECVDGRVRVFSVEMSQP